MSVDMIAATPVPASVAGAGRHGKAADAEGETPGFDKMLGEAAGKHHPHARKAAADPKGAGADEAAVAGEQELHVAGEHKHWRLFDALKAAKTGDDEGTDEPAEGDGLVSKAEHAKPAAAQGQAVVAVVQVHQLSMQHPHPSDAGDDETPGEQAGAEAEAIDASAQRGERQRAEPMTTRHANPTQAHAERSAGNAVSAQPPLDRAAADAVPQKDGAQVAAGQQADVQRPEPKAMPAKASSKEAAPEPAAAKVTVISTQVAPAPAIASQPAALSATSADLVAKLDASDALPRHLEAAATLEPADHAAGRPVTMLKIQLNPADLGTVTAKLTGAGEHLAVEVQVDNHEARHRLQSDSDQIVKALRGLGYDIDRITVQQAPHSSAMTAGGDSRGGASFTAPDQRSAGERQGQSFRQDTGQRQNETHSAAPTGGDRGDSGGGVVI